MVRSQDSTSSGDTNPPPQSPFDTFFSTTPAPTGTPVNVEVQCYLTDSSPILSEDLPVQENTANLPALPTGVKCYSIGPDGQPASTPFTTIGVSTAAASPSSDGTSNDLIAILPGVLSSIIAAIILVVGLLWYRRSKRASQRRQSRAWVQRPGGWVQDRSSDDNKEGPQDIALDDRRTFESVTV